MPDFVVHSTVSLASFAKEDDIFFQPKKFSEIEAVYSRLEALPAGSVLPCRGRDVLPKQNPAHFGEVVLTDWDFGYVTLNEGRAFFIWTDKVESFPIRGLDLRKLVHFKIASAARQEVLLVDTSLKTTASLRICLISHGYSPERGPEYALIRSLEAQALKNGWTPIVCCFLESYKFGPSRGRSERVKVCLACNFEIFWLIFFFR